jgi:EAL domain-containing protein (putative c-di-GMP-specific phosphodiesterase class I)
MEPDGNSLNRATFGPSGLTGHEVLVRGFHEAIGLTLDKPRNKIFVADLSGQIVEIDLQTLQSSVRYSASNAVTGLSIF